MTPRGLPAAPSAWTGSKMLKMSKPKTFHVSAASFTYVWGRMELISASSLHSFNSPPPASGYCVSNSDLGNTPISFLCAWCFRLVATPDSLRQVSPAARAALAHPPLSRTPESFSAQLLVNGIDKIKKKCRFEESKEWWDDSLLKCK